MDKQLLINEIADAFTDVKYPDGADFYKAIADREYQDYIDSDKVKSWQDITSDELIKYYDFIFFLNGQGMLYYLPAYMTLIVNNDAVADSESPQSLFMAIADDLDIANLNSKQKKVVSDFLLYCREVIHPTVELNEELLDNAMQKMN